MRSLVDMLRNNIDAAAVAIACFAVFAGSHVVDRCRVEQQTAFRTGVHRIWIAPIDDAVSAAGKSVAAVETVFF